jgi:hypothetical protein
MGTQRYRKPPGVIEATHSARADFQCIACDELMELPLKASACPVCGGLLERRFTTPPAVLRGAEQGAAVVRAPALDNAATDEFNAQKSARAYSPGMASVGEMAGPIAQTTRSRDGLKIGVPALAGALSPQAKMGSHEILPIFGALNRLRGPRPGPGSKSS